MVIVDILHNPLFKYTCIPSKGAAYTDCYRSALGWFGNVTFMQPIGYFIVGIHITKKYILTICDCSIARPEIPDYNGRYKYFVEFLKHPYYGEDLSDMDLIHDDLLLSTLELEVNTHCKVELAVNLLERQIREAEDEINRLRSFQEMAEKYHLLNEIKMKIGDYDILI